MNPSIETENLGKNYCDVKAVQHPSLRVNLGKIYALLGLNGAGKTTTIRMLLGMICLLPGRRLVNHRQPPDRPFHRSGRCACHTFLVEIR
jgi:ABC-type multidrug transport system ATPase subunit